jgi:FMN phosphatase YigB (HAD superfamily)
MRFTVPALKLKEYFNDVVCSSDIGLLKKDVGGESFRRVAQKMNMPLSESLLIDNSRNSCSTFARLGGHALLVDQQHSLAYWLQKLKDAGVPCVH